MSKYTSQWYEETETIRWEMLPSCGELLREVCDDVRKIMCLTTDNRYTFRRHWGKYDFIFRGEFSPQCWVRNVGGVEILVFTAKNMGSSYEIASGMSPAEIEPSQAVRSLDRKSTRLH